MKESMLTTWVIILHEDKREWNIIWKVKMEPGEKVVFPTGEQVTFVGSNSYDNSLFVIE